MSTTAFFVSHVGSTDSFLCRLSFGKGLYSFAWVCLSVGLFDKYPNESNSLLNACIFRHTLLVDQRTFPSASQMPRSPCRKKIELSCALHAFNATIFIPQKIVVLRTFSFWEQTENTWGNIWWSVGHQLTFLLANFYGRNNAGVRYGALSRWKSGFLLVKWGRFTLISSYSFSYNTA